MSEHPELDRLQEKIRRLHGLIETSAIISSSLDLDEVLRLVLEKAQGIAGAEASAILLYNPDTRKLEFEVALGEKGPMLQSLRKTMTLDLGQGIAGSVAQTRQVEWVPDAMADRRVAKTVDAVTGFVTRNVLCGPLAIHDRLIGVAEVMNLAHPERCGPDEIEIFGTFCQHVAIAIENARLHGALLEQERERQQLEFASIVQQSFLPKHFPTCPRQRFRVDAKSLPASAVGGDFYDFLSLGDDRLAVVIGDVSGKGVPAALFMAKLISDLRFIGQRLTKPAEILEAMNRDLADQERRGMFVTTQYLVLDAGSGVVQVADGGHLPPLWYHHDTGEVEALDLSGGPPLGVLPEVTYPETTLQLEHGDSLLLLTDGVSERTNDAGEAFGFPRLLEAVRAAGRTEQSFVQPVLRTVEAFTAGGRHHDDLTLVQLTWC
jgi:sigma-B regulation protein RsbU (phosphoserine phosphatase)